MGRVTAATDLTLLSIVLLALAGFGAALLWLAARLVPMDIRMVPGLSVAFTCVPANIGQSCFAGWCLNLLLSAPAYKPAISQQCFDGPHRHSHGAWNGCRLHLHTSQQSARHALLIPRVIYMVPGPAVAFTCTPANNQSVMLCSIDRIG